MAVLKNRMLDLKNGKHHGVIGDKCSNVSNNINIIIYAYNLLCYGIMSYIFIEKNITYGNINYI